MTTWEEMGRVVCKNADKQKVIEWMFSQDTGVSSQNLAAEYLGVKCDAAVMHFGLSGPHDPADLGRCLRLIALVPEIRSCVDSLATKSTHWAKAAAVWDEISASMEDEVGIDWSKAESAPKTYKLMEEAGL